MTTTNPQKTQILVIGGGPGGSTAAAMLAREGFDVTLLERDAFPRYHIGESLLPSVLDFLDLSGARPKVEAYGFQRKPGGHIEWGSNQWDLYFNELTGNHQYSFQVIRSEFDKLLLDHAESEGVKVMQCVEVQKIHFHDAAEVSQRRPYAATIAQVGESGEAWDINFDYLVDASGRAGIMATRYLRNRKYHDAFKNVAVWGYWEDAGRLPHPKEGAIATVSIPNGWIWAIPLHDGMLSVGVVLHKDSFKEKNSRQDLETLYAEALADNETVSGLIASGHRVGDLKVETDYSYASTNFAGPGYFMVGDAACFLDPLLSTGVHLAMLSAMLTAVSITAAERGDVSHEEATEFFENSYRCAYLRLLVFLTAFYHQYDGKDSIFWMARRLSNHDVPETKIKLAFTSLMSGVEDLMDVREGAELMTRDLVLDEMSRRVAENLQIRHDKKQMKALYDDHVREDNATFFGQVEGIDVIARGPEQAVGGLYVKTSPRLGLARVS
ncbi:MAG: tryptophan 7-halogenase [Anaerolineae bacterium]|nr:tryptophan 7-halogenase [Anaerolineae bacterium]